jgi:hypothetical protein
MRSVREAPEPPSALAPHNLRYVQVTTVLIGASGAEEPTELSQGLPPEKAGD